MSSGRNRPWPPVWRCPRVIAPSVSRRRGDRAEEPLLGLHIRGDGPEERRFAPDWCGWCARAPEWRHRPSSPAPAGSAPAGAGSAPKGPHDSCARCPPHPRRPECASLVIHEGRSLAKVGGGRAVLDDQAGRCAFALSHDAPGPPRDLRHHIRAGSAGRSGRARAGTGGSEPSFSSISSRRATASRLSTGCPSRNTGPRRKIALAVGEWFVE